MTRPLIVAAFLLATAAVSAQAPPLATPGDVKAALDRGLELRAKSNPRAAKPYLQQAIDGATRLDDKRLLQAALFGLADAQSDLNDLAAALDSLQRAYDALPDPRGRARAQYANLRGRIYQELREREPALEAYGEGLTVATALGDENLLGSLNNELGLVYWRFDRNFDLAIQHYDRALEYFTRTGNHRGVMVVMNNSGNLFRHPGAYPEAERRYRAGLAAADRAGMDGDPMLLKNMGIVMRETGRLKESEASLLRAVMLADTRGNGRIEWQGRMELGTFYSASDPQKAADYFEQTLKVLEARNTNTGLEGFRAGALSGAVTIYDDPYDLYTDFLLNHGREREAFFVAERARARAFLDTLSAAREEIARALPEEFVRDERAILESISNSQAALRAMAVDASRRASLQAAVRQDEDRLTQIRVRLAIEHPALAHARYPRIWGVEDIQRQLLRPNEVLLQYFLGAKAGTLWAITTDGMHVRRLPPRAQLETDVRAFLEAIGRPDAVFQDSAAVLGEALLPDLDEVLTGSARLIVVPHGILNYVPFEALLGSKGRFLIEDHAMSYAPSTSSLAFLRARQSSGTEVIALGDPVMRAAGAATDRGANLDRVGALKPLVHSRPEIRAVSRVYGSVSHLFEQEAATEAALTGPLAARAGIIHIATHGLIDEEMPERSGLALTAAPGSDGILQMREVYNLRLNAALVTLSACQTALGKSITGEGMVGLSRAFFYAGSNAVLASLWNVNDASTERLMRPFYQSLASGAGIDDALQSAKVAMIGEGGRLAHPYYWAAFVVSGNGASPVAVRPGWTVSLWAVSLLAALVLMGAALAWRRVR